MSLKNAKKWALLSAMLLILTGCVERTATGDPTGWVWHLLGKPMESIIIWFAQLLGGGIGSYGIGIILVTIIIRILILPLHLEMTKVQTINTEKSQFIKPLTDKLNERLRQATTMEEKQAAQMELLALQREAGIQLISARGCLPLFIQMPIFSALYFATISSNIIRDDVFAGVSLNAPSLILVLLSAGAYFVQGLLAQIGMTDEQKQLNRSMLWITPAMQVLFAISVPAGAALYWVVGGVVMCFTTLYTNLVQKPKIKAQVAQEMAKHPIQLKTREDVTPSTQPINYNPEQRRNVGKQNRR